MTNEDAILCLKGIKNYGKDTFTEQADWQKSLDIAIKTLEQESILDKIRAEIEETYTNITYQENRDRKATWGLRKALEIIDKYKAESEE
jgi:hypothetical protein